MPIRSRCVRFCFVRYQTRFSGVKHSNASPFNDFATFSAFIAKGDALGADKLLFSLASDERNHKVITTPIFNSLIRSWTQKKDLTRAFAVYDLLLKSNRIPNTNTIHILLSGILATNDQLHRLPELLQALDRHLIAPSTFLPLQKQNNIIPTTNRNNTDPHIAVKLTPGQSFRVDPYERQIFNETTHLDERVQYYRKLSKGISKIHNKNRKAANNTAQETPAEAEILILRWFQSLSQAIRKEREILRGYKTCDTTTTTESDARDLIKSEETRMKMLYYLESISEEN